MKKILSISAVTFATIFVVLLTLLPQHHHHGEEACFVIEECESRDDFNDISTPNCAISAHDYYILKKGLSIDNSQFKEYPILFVLTDSLFPMVVQTGTVNLFGDVFLNSYLDALSLANGLRAPPIG